MGKVNLEALADEAGRMAMLLRAQAATVDQQRVALSRYALVWWQGEAAGAYQQRVHERVAALAALSSRLAEAARLWEELEEAADEAAADLAAAGAAAAETAGGAFGWGGLGWS